MTKPSTDYLREAKCNISRAWDLIEASEEAAQTNAQLATACALVALVERLDAALRVKSVESL